MCSIFGSSILFLLYCLNMTRRHESAEAYLLSPQDRFYNSSVRWVESMISRHDTGAHWDILENDVEKYPYQSLDVPLVPAYQPTDEEIARFGKSELQQSIIEKLTINADKVMGVGRFDEFVSELVKLKSQPSQPNSLLWNIYGRMQSPRQNIATVGYHPNIVTLPIYGGAVPVGLSRISTPKRPFDFFDFTRRNLLPINPALAVASFDGTPVFEGLTAFSTLIKIPPPTRSTLRYMDRDVRKKLTVMSETAIKELLASLYAENKSAYVTIDPTASTFETVEKDGRLEAVRRNPVSRPLEAMILNDFNMVIPITMRLSESGASWYIGDLTSLRVFNIDTEQGQRLAHNSFQQVIKELDSATESLYGVPVVVDHPEREIGGVALADGPSV